MIGVVVESLPSEVVRLLVPICVSVKSEATGHRNCERLLLCMSVQSSSSEGDVLCFPSCSLVHPLPLEESCLPRLELFDDLLDQRENFMKSGWRLTRQARSLARPI